jgi:hypothetical protein
VIGEAIVAPGVEPARAPASLGLVDQLLRDRTAILARIDRGHDLAGLARTMIVTIAVATALVGASLGSYRGGVQIAYAAIKVPLVLLLTAALCAPTLTALNLALGRPASLPRDLARFLSALAFGSLVLLAEAPLLLLARSIELDYHQTTLLMVGCFTVGGAASVAMLSTALRRAAAAHAGAVLATTLTVFALVGGQMAWTLRPYLVRPRTPDVPFVRSLEGSLYDAVLDTARSAQGDYRRDHAPLPGEEQP